MFKKLLIANRGEIAVRVIRACKELGIETVAVHSEVDADALHARLADQAVCIGPADPRKSYLYLPSILAAAEITGADAVHPGYGFLSENAEFAQACIDCGLTFVGPTPKNIRQWGSKLEARALAKSLGLDVIEGSTMIKNAKDAVAKAKQLGFPLMLKASSGGGGRGMRVVRDATELERAFEPARAEAASSFEGDELYLERFIDEPRHIEFQVLGDGKGFAAVLGERECSIQRRHQKLLEEAPSPAVSMELRGDMAKRLRHVVIESGYTSAGTFEFLMDERGELTFLETNTRIQVEHPVTEAVTGIDLVAAQIRIAAGEPHALPAQDLTPQGHAIECRINAEDPVTFAPSPGTITEYRPPGGAGIRVDSGIYGGSKVPSSYDPLLMKVVAHGHTRLEAIARMRRALGETIVEGIRTNIPLHQRILADPAFVAGEVSTRFVERL